MLIASSSQLMWYSTRATGVVALLLLTATVVLGVLTSVRFGTARWPRFATQDLHRSVSLLAMAFVGLHVLAAVSDSFAPIGWLSVIVPFTSPYRRFWLGLGTASVDVLLAVLISSLVRQHISHRLWRLLHWLAYASWPLALFHSLGTGTDPHLGWMVLLVVVCVAAVLGAIGWRLVAGWPGHAGTRVLTGAMSVIAVIGGVAWAKTGPLRPGWAARAGTPSALLAGPTKASGTTPGSRQAVSSGSGQSASQLPPPPYHAALAGTITQQTQSGGLLTVRIAARTSGSLDAMMRVTIVGTPGDSGGVVMSGSQATFGNPSSPAQYQGSVVALDGTQLVLGLQDRGGDPLQLSLELSISGSQISGELNSLSAGSAANGQGSE